MEKISRQNVNNSQVKAQDFPKSGFDLSYKSRADFVLGELHVSGYQHIMPADKMSGSTDIKYTFNRLVVPEISDVEVGQYNFYVPYRSIDTSFIKGIVPTELNRMSYSWRTPQFSLGEFITPLFNRFIFSPIVPDAPLYSTIEAWRNSGSTGLDIYSVLMALIPYTDAYQATYNYGFAKSLRDYWLNAVNNHSGNIPWSRDNLFVFLCDLLIPLFGRNSLFDTLGYTYLRTYDIRQLANRMQGQADDMINFISVVPQNEYAIRAYYAIWYEHFRDPFLQKRTVDLPDWRDFGSQSLGIYGSDTIETYFLKLFTFFTPRFRSWTKDMFVGAMPDDMSRHVFAPIFSDSSADIESLGDSFNYLNAENPDTASGVNAAIYNLDFLDPLTGMRKSVLCPLPKAVNDSLSTLDSNLFSNSAFHLDLRDLRKSQMLERYLKRNFYFGDEYQDRMLAHYGSVISDNSIRRPHLLSSSVSAVNPRQEISTAGTEGTPVGTRTATAADSAHGDSFTFFAEEFGIMITILCVRPIAQYAGICPQNLLSMQTDFPLPEFANNNDEFGRVMEIALSGVVDDSRTPSNYYQFGHYPYAHAYRSRVDEVHGSFLDDKQDYTFRRFFGLDSAESTPKLNSNFITCLPNLGMFADTVRLDGQGYYTADHHFYVERVLPTPVEEI